MATIDKIYTSQDAAEELNVSDAHIRRLCIEHKNIGQKHGKMWILTEADIERIKNLPEFGKRKRKSA